MSFSSKVSVLSSIGILAALATASAAFHTGCDQCAALCLDNVHIEGDVSVSVDDKPDLRVKVCHEADCRESLTKSDNGDVFCSDGNLHCQLKKAPGGKNVLAIDMHVGENEIEEGNEVTVLVEVVESGEVLVDKTLLIKSVGEDELCGRSCDVASLSWDSGAP